MKHRVIDKIVWWIPIRRLRDSLRYKIYDFIIESKKHDKYHINGYSQFEQDRRVFNLLKGKKDGFFVDIGAYDGITISNTFAFEKLGWKGICVEANPDIFEKLKKNRTCDTYNYAVTSIKDEYVEFKKADVLGVIESLASSAHKERIGNSMGGADLVKVKTSTFNNLMKNYPDRTYIDYLSLDVEGSEMDVLKTIDFNKYKFGVLTIENNANPNEIRDFMYSRGYDILIENIGCDLLFMSK